MIKRILLAAAFAAIPVTVFAQSMGPIIRDPASGGFTHDPALAGNGIYMEPFFGPSLTRDPAGGTMINDNAGFRGYVMAQHMRSYRYAEPVEIGTVLPSRGVVYRDVPAAYGAPGYRYTIVNDEAVIVEPRSRRVVQIIE
ncbi:conserved exported hypothetical protein [Hyphomicrobiales bacterium]|nr:conserved exported hypothetical protein [Hyphomicrobiales bacterium]CAH1700919.1 conserved exported hypothetical protein [Hyphomicrobiales bacterium]CAI0344794.1 conserved exported hypothetical protein [Hyphomicrobiales bacterium]